jgi:hypothetical protein
VIPETAPIEIMPEDAGLILADAYSAEILRQAPEHRIAADTRCLSLTGRFRSRTKVKRNPHAIKQLPHVLAITVAPHLMSFIASRQLFVINLQRL